MNQIAPKPYWPSSSDLLEMSLYGFREHAVELLGKYSRMSQEQRTELRIIAEELMRVTDVVR